MLDILRKHTQSWVTKVVFTIIILSFILFFGYSQMQSGAGKAGAAATVNGESVPYGRYKLALENTREFYKQMFNGEIPENMYEQVRSSALFQVVNQVLLAQLAKKFDLFVTDAEIYEQIASNPNFQKDGKFDPKAYKEVFFPFFENKYGLNYEDLIKDDLLARKAQAFITDSVTVSEIEAKQEFDRENTKWAFEVIELPDTAIEGVEYDIPTLKIAKNLIDSLNEKSTDKYRSIVKKYKLNKKELKDISLRDKSKVLPGAIENETFAEIFALTKEAPILNHPIKSGSNTYVIKLATLDTATPEKWKKEGSEFIKSFKAKKEQAALRQWQEKFKNESKIEEFVLNSGK